VVTLTTPDGVRLEAHHDPTNGPAADGLAVVLAHGFTCSATRPATRRTVAALTPFAGVVSFDFRGHGGSTGQSTVGELEILDVEAAVRWARTLGYQRVATLGFSMGAAVVLRHAALHGGVAAVAAVSGPSRWYYRGTRPMRRAHWVIERRLGRLFGRVALKTRVAPGGWDPVPEAPHEVIGRISPTPVLIVHGDADPYFPLEHAQKLHAAAAEPRELWVEAGYGHAETAASPELLTRIASWLATAAHPARSPHPTQILDV
jgi:pimeloyl-ACP methyl ester carboxylesterase